MPTIAQDKEEEEGGRGATSVHADDSGSSDGSSSEDPSVVGRVDEDDDDDEDIEAATLTKDQVAFLGDSTMGKAFYSAYENVVGRPAYYDVDEVDDDDEDDDDDDDDDDDGPEPLLYLDDDDDGGRARRTKKRRRYHHRRRERTRPVIGIDRATSRGTAVRRALETARRGCFGGSGDVAGGTSAFLLSAVFVACFVILTSLVVDNGATRERQQHDDGTSNEDVYGANVGPPPSPTTPRSSPSPTIDVPPDDDLLITLKRSYYDYLRDVGGSDYTKDVASHVVSNAREIWLDHRTNFGKSVEEQTPQYRAYRYMYAKDVILATDDVDRILQIYALIVFYEYFGWTEYMDVGGMGSECAWPGVTCRALDVDGVYVDDVDDDDDDAVVDANDLRVVGLNVGGRNRDASSSAPLLDGTIPVELMFLKYLETLDVSHNSLEGGLWGPMITRWNNIKALEFNDNRFGGDIPSELGSMLQLQKLSLHHNNFRGQVPEELCELRDGSLHFLWADCSPMPSTNLPKVICPIVSCCSICFEGDDDDNGPIAEELDSTVDTSHVVAGDAESELKLMLSGASFDKGVALEDIQSPQFHAYAWLAADASYTDASHAQSYDQQRLLQRYALATLYFATNGPYWGNNDKWLSLLDECSWHGVSGCRDANLDGNAIVSIDLKGNRLKGSIPPEIFGFLQTLTTLSLANNELYGPIPKEIGIMSEVDIIDLGDNHLTSIPSEMGNLKMASHIFLQGNDFGSQSMPDEVCELRDSGSLTLLWADCTQCSLSCCTTCFSDSSEGGENAVDAEGASDKNDVAITPADLDGKLLTSLKEMSHDNGTSLDDLSSPQYKAYNWLVTLGISGTDITSDDHFLQRYGLAVLFFSTSGHGWIQNSRWLSSSDVCDWYLVSCNGESMVIELDLNGNNLVGRIPIELTDVRKLEILDLADNEIYGPIPTEFASLQDMEVLRLGGNLLTGNIPPELADLANLQELYLHANEFTGTSMPEEICALRAQNLNTLWADCVLGDITKVSCEETCCTACFDSDSVNQSQNGDEATQTTGTTQVENQLLRTFLREHMDGFEQRLDDTQSAAYAAYMWLANDEAYNNNLDAFRKLQRFGLATFFISTSPELDWTVLIGWLSSEHECDWYGIFCALNDTVTSISLPNNGLTGTIPPEIALAATGGAIRALNLAGNNISGEIVEQLGTMTHLELLDLRSNGFTGQIPSQLGELKVLKSLMLQDNELTGNVPAEVCSLRTMGTLDELIADFDSGDLGTVICDIDSCCTGIQVNMEAQFEPVWFSRATGWEGQTYDDAVSFCESVGSGGKKLCNYETYCPKGERSAPYSIGLNDPPEDMQWAPIGDGYNHWVQIGNFDTDMACMSFESLMNIEGPSWGVSGDESWSSSITGYLMCCRVVD